MPFIGKDWRSPGEAWVKTESLGWQRMKTIESQLYPACNQNHPACSWPPRGFFGQYMAEHCNNNHHHQQTETNCNTNESDKNNENVVPIDGQSAGGCCSSASSFSDSGSDSSRSNSASCSPINSPEKTTGAAYHLHPIAISSPYGKYSCCSHQHHHQLDSPLGSPSQQRRQGQGGNETNKFSRCLSRESLRSCCSPTRTSPATSSSKTIAHNKSVADFRNSSEQENANATNDNSGARQLPQTSQFGLSLRESHPVVVDDGAPSLELPTLMKNGARLSGNDLELINNTEEGDERQASSQTLVDNYTTQRQSNCNGCCCTLHNAGHFKDAAQTPPPQSRTAPHCRISVRTREVAMYNTISEAFYRLDFCNAIHDIRRFNYICKLLHLLITQNLTSLSGCATKVLFTMLEQVAWEVSSNKRNIHVLKNLLDELKQMIQKYYCWGRPIGSSLLWQQHFETIERISRIVDGIELSPTTASDQSEEKPTFDTLPTEMIREILLRLNDYRDLISSAKASPVMRSMIDSQSIWRKLCRYHFTEQQLKLALESRDFGLTRGGRSLRSIKYARTASADGRSSYRNRVSHNQNPAPTNKPTTRQQLEQTASRRCETTASSSANKPSTSYVSQAIRIFDRGESSKTCCDAEKNGGETSSEQHCSRSEARGRRSDGSATASRGGSDQDGSQIDWERVFHQLRKRYDLKEEYADCLLLCRHCRCLFWKSIGHPCIRSDDSPKEDEDREAAAADYLSRRLDGVARQLNLIDERAIDNLDVPSRESNPRQPQQQHNPMPSVAALSRNFDGSNRPLEGLPSLSQNERQPQSSRPGNSSQRAGRRPLADLNPAAAVRGALQERNLNRANRLGPANARNSARNNSDQLVPKHVTITPQAFLKFFSL